MPPAFLAEPDASAGFSLVETVLAVAILATCLLSLAQVFVVAGRGFASMRATTVASILAAQKIEQLRVTVAPPADGIEQLDRHGAVVDGAEAVAYTRRWSVRPVTADPDQTMTIEVRVAPGLPGGAGSAPEVGLITIRQRSRP